MGIKGMLLEGMKSCARFVCGTGSSILEAVSERLKQRPEPLTRYRWIVCHASSDQPSVGYGAQLGTTHVLHKRLVRAFEGNRPTVAYPSYNYMLETVAKLIENIRDEVRETGECNGISFSWLSSTPLVVGVDDPSMLGLNPGVQKIQRNGEPKPSDVSQAHKRALGPTRGYHKERFRSSGLFDKLKRNEHVVGAHAASLQQQANQRQVKDRCAIDIMVERLAEADNTGRLSKERLAELLELLALEFEDELSAFLAWVVAGDFDDVACHFFNPLFLEVVILLKSSAGLRVGLAREMVLTALKELMPNTFGSVDDLELFLDSAVFHDDEVELTESRLRRLVVLILWIALPGTSLDYALGKHCMQVDGVAVGMGKMRDLGDRATAVPLHVPFTLTTLVDAYREDPNCKPRSLELFEELLESPEQLQRWSHSVVALCAKIFPSDSGSRVRDKLMDRLLKFFLCDRSNARMWANFPRVSAFNMSVFGWRHTCDVFSQARGTDDCSLTVDVNQQLNSLVQHLSEKDALGRVVRVPTYSEVLEESRERAAAQAAQREPKPRVPDQLPDARTFSFQFAVHADDARAPGSADGAKHAAIKAALAQLAQRLQKLQHGAASALPEVFSGLKSEAQRKGRGLGSPLPLICRAAAKATRDQFVEEDVSAGSRKWLRQLHALLVDARARAAETLNVRPGEIHLQTILYNHEELKQRVSAAHEEARKDLAAARNRERAQKLKEGTGRAGMADTGRGRKNKKKGSEGAKKRKSQPKKNAPSKKKAHMSEEQPAADDTRYHMASRVDYKADSLFASSPVMTQVFTSAAVVDAVKAAAAEQEGAQEGAQERAQHTEFFKRFIQSVRDQKIGDAAAGALQLQPDERILARYQRIFGRHLYGKVFAQRVQALQDNTSSSAVFVYQALLHLTLLVHSPECKVLSVEHLLEDAMVPSVLRHFNPLNVAIQDRQGVHGDRLARLETGTRAEQTTYERIKRCAELCQRDTAPRRDLAHMWHYKVVAERLSAGRDVMRAMQTVLLITTFLDRATGGELKFVPLALWLFAWVCVARQPLGDALDILIPGGAVKDAAKVEFVDEADEVLESATFLSNGDDDALTKRCKEYLLWLKATQEAKYEATLDALRAPLFSDCMDELDLSLLDLEGHWSVGRSLELLKGPDSFKLRSALSNVLFAKFVNSAPLVASIPRRPQLFPMFNSILVMPLRNALLLLDDDARGILRDFCGASLADAFCVEFNQLVGSTDGRYGQAFVYKRWDDFFKLPAVFAGHGPRDQSGVCNMAFHSKGLKVNFSGYRTTRRTLERELRSGSPFIDTSSEVDVTRDPNKLVPSTVTGMTSASVALTPDTLRVQASRDALAAREQRDAAAEADAPHDLSWKKREELAGRLGLEWQFPAGSSKFTRRSRLEECQALAQRLGVRLEVATLASQAAELSAKVDTLSQLELRPLLEEWCGHSYKSKAPASAEWQGKRIDYNRQLLRSTLNEVITAAAEPDVRAPDAAAPRAAADSTSLLDVLHYVAPYLNLFDTARLSTVCKDFRSMLESGPVYDLLSLGAICKHVVREPLGAFDLGFKIEAEGVAVFLRSVRLRVDPETNLVDFVTDGVFFPLGTRGNNIKRASQYLTPILGRNPTLHEIEGILRGERMGDNLPEVSSDDLHEAIYQQARFSDEGDVSRYAVRRAIDAEVRYLLRRLEKLRNVENKWREAENERLEAENERRKAENKRLEAENEVRKENNEEEEPLLKLVPLLHMVPLCDKEFRILIGMDCSSGKSRKGNKMGHFQASHKRLTDCLQGWRSCLRVSEMYSSQRCYRCLNWLKYATKREIRSKECTDCHKYVDRDQNAALCFVYGYLYSMLHGGAIHPAFTQNRASQASISSASADDYYTIL